jgi:hypothetical protein
MALIPPIGTSGVFRLKSPFAALLRSNTSYRCDAVRRFADIYEQGIDPYTSYYAPHGLSKQQFDNDVGAGNCIVSLASSGDHWVYVPSSYIEAFPNQGGITYQGIVVGVPLGAVPTYMDLSAVCQALQNVVRDMMGINAVASQVAVTAVENVRVEDHNAIMAARAHYIENATTDSAKAKNWENQYRALKQQYDQLAAYVVSKGL